MSVVALARQLGFSETEVQNLFHTQGDVLYTGQEVWIDACGEANGSTASELMVHIVRLGETLPAIADRYDLDVLTLARFNGIRNVHALRVGMRLRIPVSVDRQSPAP